MVAAQADSASVYWNGEGEQRERGMEKVSRERNGSGNFLCLIMAAHVMAWMSMSHFDHLLLWEV